MPLLDDLHRPKRFQASSCMLWFFVIGLVLFFAWSVFHTVAETTRGTGEVISSSPVHRLRITDGGVLDSLRVAEGDLVQAGQVVALLTKTPGGMVEESTQHLPPKHSIINIIRAPINGIAKNLRMASPGAALFTGEELMQIIPIPEKLIIEAKVHPEDMSAIHSGLSASVTFNAENSALRGTMEGTVSYISADIIKEDGNSKKHNSYRVYVEADCRQIKTISGKLIDILPGMSSQVDIHTGRSTVLDNFLNLLRLPPQGT
nr:HlyD family efflux transporter periplasmic adaptor subunit [uncultured Desulfobulbus sp.]